jgi:hypothetical protein
MARLRRHAITPGCTTGADAVAVLAEGDITEMVRCLDGDPMIAGQRGRPSRTGLRTGRAGVRIYRAELHLLRVKVSTAALDLGDLDGMREPRSTGAGHGGRLQPATSSGWA